MSKAMKIIKENLVLPYSASVFSLFGSLKQINKNSVNISWLNVQKVIKEIQFLNVSSFWERQLCY